MTIKVKEERKNIKDFIEENKLKSKKKVDDGKISVFTDFLYENPSHFLGQFSEIKEALVDKEDYFDIMGNSLFYHYFIAMHDAKKSENHLNYDVLNNNYIKFLEFFSDKVNLIIKN